MLKQYGGFLMTTPDIDLRLVTVSPGASIARRPIQSGHGGR